MSDIDRVLRSNLKLRHLQLVVALDKNYGLKIADPGAAQKILQNVNTIAAAVESHLAASPPA